MLFIISLISFIAINLAPNSFFASGELNPNITPEAIAELKAIYGSYKPLIYSIFLVDKLYNSTRFWNILFKWCKSKR